MSHPIKSNRAASGFLGDPRSTGTGSRVRVPDIAATRGTKTTDPRK